MTWAAALSSLEAREIVEDVEATAWWELGRAVPADAAGRLGLSVERLGGVTVSTCSMFDDVLANRAFGPGLATPGSRSRISQLVAHFRSRGLRNYALQVSPPVPEGLRTWLSDVGLECRSRWVKVLRDCGNPPETSLPYHVRKIAHDEAEAFVDTAARGFGWTPIRATWMAATVGHAGWHHYLAYVAGRPVAAGALFVSGAVGWLGIGATLPEYRRRRAHGAILARRITDAIQMGCRWLVAETGEVNPSYRNMLRAGFHPVYLRENYGEKAGPTNSLARRMALWTRRVVR